MASPPSDAESDTPRADGFSVGSTNLQKAVRSMGRAPRYSAGPYPRGAGRGGVVVRCGGRPGPESGVASDTRTLARPSLPGACPGSVEGGPRPEVDGLGRPVA